ncbi:MAG TPA: hypothetical protein VF040_09730 [Ktedonobacterales bacterium]
MTKVLEILFRNKIKLLVLLLLPVLVSGVVVFVLPRSYEVTARLLALRRYQVLGATGPESDLQSSPAATQATALIELLQTENFDLAVAKDTDLGNHIGVPASDTQRWQDAIYTEISTQVQVSAPSYSLVVITYSNKDPEVAAQVVKAVITHYGVESATHAIAEGQELLNNYQGQLIAAKQEADSATQAAAQYLKDHHLTFADASTDPQYQLLTKRAEQAQATLTSIQTNINSVNQQIVTIGAGGKGMYTIVDPPQVPAQPTSRSKSLVLGGAIGLGLGLLASVGYFLILVRLDQSIYSSADVSELADYPVLIQIPQLPRRSAAWITQANEPLLTDSGT